MSDPARYAKVMAAYDEALKKAPGDAEIAKRRAFFAAANGKGDLIVATYAAERARAPRDGEKLNGNCWSLATLGVGLDEALASCDAAIAVDRQPAFLDSRGLVHVRRASWKAAIADYDAALAARPGVAESLYGRAIAKAALGDHDGTAADLSAARKVDPKIDEQFDGYGLKLDLRRTAAVTSPAG